MMSTDVRYLKTSFDLALEAYSVFFVNQTTIYLASCSKAFLSASMGILMDDFAQGRNVTALPDGVDIFDWDTKIKELLPEEWVLMDKWMEQKANVRDALSHSTGIYRCVYPTTTCGVMRVRTLWLMGVVWS